MFIIRYIILLILLLNLGNCFGDEDYTKCSQDEKDFWKFNAIQPLGIESEKENSRNFAIIALYDCIEKDKQK